MAEEERGGLVSIIEECAAKQVPGSMLRVKVDEKTYLFEAGSDMKNENGKPSFTFNPSEISNLVLGHGHADHIGKTLDLIAAGFAGRIYSTEQTAAIAHLQFDQQVSGPIIYNRMVAGRKFRSGPREGQVIPFKQKKFVSEDVVKAMGMFGSEDGKHPGYSYDKEIPVGDGVSVRFYQAGHIPGAAQTRYKIKKDGKEINILFAYDLGRTDYEILNHPVADIPLVKRPQTYFAENIDYIVVEATYGNRVHRPLEESLATLEQAAKDVAKTRGVLVLPAFSIMRTQMLWYFLFNLYQEGKLPKNMRFYSSSPMADQVARIMLSHKEDLNKEALEEFKSRNDNPFFFKQLEHHDKYDETKRVIEESVGNVPIGVIAASGMCDMGRIVSVLQATISDPRNIVLLTGYSSPGTRADLMLKKEPVIDINGILVPLKADVRKMGGLSGHADAIEMIAHLKHIHDPTQGSQFKGIFIKHGEPDACEALKQEIIAAGYDSATVHVMEKGQEYKLAR